MRIRDWSSDVCSADLAGASAKDIALAVIARIGAGGAVGHVIEFSGCAVQEMTMEERLTLCNMSIEAGARRGLIAPDATTYQYMHGQPFAPRRRASGRAEETCRASGRGSGCQER